MHWCAFCELLPSPLRRAHQWRGLGAAAPREHANTRRAKVLVRHPEAQARGIEQIVGVLVFCDRALGEPARAAFCKQHTCANCQQTDSLPSGLNERMPGHVAGRGSDSIYRSDVVQIANLRNQARTRTQYPHVYTLFHRHKAGGSWSPRVPPLASIGSPNSTRSHAGVSRSRLPWSTDFSWNRFILSDLSGF